MHLNILPGQKKPAVLSMTALRYEFVRPIRLHISPVWLYRTWHWDLTIIWCIHMVIELSHTSHLNSGRGLSHYMSKQELLRCYPGHTQKDVQTCLYKTIIMHYHVYICLEKLLFHIYVYLDLDHSNTISMGPNNQNLRFFKKI